MSASDMQVNGANGHAMGGEPSETPADDGPEISTEPTSETPAKKKRGRPPKRPASTATSSGELSSLSLGVGPTEAGVVIDPRQLGLLAGESTPNAITIEALRVVCLALDDAWKGKARAYIADAQRFRILRERSTDPGSVAHLLSMESRVLDLALRTNDCREEWRNALAGMGVRL